jgi:replicative DNA helicase
MDKNEIILKQLGKIIKEVTQLHYDSNDENFKNVNQFANNLIFDLYEQKKILKSKRIKTD